MSFRKVLDFCWNNLIMRNLLIFIVLILVMIMILLIWMDGYTMHNKAVRVPDVKGLQIEEAAPAFQAKKLRFVVVDSIYSRTAEPGAVVEQIPAADAKVKENRIVFLTLNAKSKRTVELPDVRDLSHRQAVATLRSQGFEVAKVEYVPYKYVDAVAYVFYNGKVVAAGARLPYGAKVVLHVGAGQQTMPDSTELSMPEESPQDKVSETDKGWFE